jgi:hypothetical protein
MTNENRKRLALFLQCATVWLLGVMLYVTICMAFDIRRIVVMFEQAYEDPYGEGERHNMGYEDAELELRI